MSLSREQEERLQAAERRIDKAARKLALDATDSVRRMIGFCGKAAVSDTQVIRLVGRKTWDRMSDEEREEARSRAAKKRGGRKREAG